MLMIRSAGALHEHGSSELCLHRRHLSSPCVRRHDAAVFPGRRPQPHRLHGAEKGGRASKAFFYDSVDDDSPDAEARRERLEQIRSLDGFHVREGTVSRDKKRQKQVDVQLAVECLTHAFNKNVWHVTLIAGDLDFKPLIDALINLCVHIHVYYEPKSGARRLYRAADVAVPITLPRFWDWSVSGFQQAHPIPRATSNGSHTGEFLLRQGTWKERQVNLWEDRTHGEHTIYVAAAAGANSLEIRFGDRDRLEQYFRLIYGSIDWEPKPA
jgi:hypothetical protein